jgi:hypothetical protein
VSQALAYQPYLAAHGKQDECWTQLAKTLRENPELPMPVTGRSARDRLNCIVKLFQAENRADLRKSGKEDDYNVRERFHTEITGQHSRVEQSSSDSPSRRHIISHLLFRAHLAYGPSPQAVTAELTPAFRRDVNSYIAVQTSLSVFAHARKRRLPILSHICARTCARATP